MLTDDDRLRIAREDYAFFSNEHKPGRERWVVDRWLLADAGGGFPVRPGGDPPDFIVGERGVEVVELQEPGRRRGDQYRARIDAAKDGFAVARTMVPRKRVSARGHEWVVGAVEQKSNKYEPSTSAGWTLLIYVNIPFADCLAWTEVEARLEELAPPFAAIEVVFDTGAGPVAKTVWRSTETRSLREQTDP